MIEIGADKILQWVPVNPTILMAWMLFSALLTVPQQCCLSLGTPLLTLAITNIGLLLQYSSAYGLEVFGRRLGLLLFGLPNLCMTLYTIAILSLHCPLGLTSKFAMRQNCWFLYTAIVPVFLIPQAASVLMLCPVDLGAQACVNGLFLGWL